MNTKKVGIGLSGGVDSSVAAYIMKTEGYEVSGYYLDMQSGICGNEMTENIRDAERVAAHLDIPFKVIDCREIFRNKIVDYFADEYMSGRTPNPCVFCNPTVKFRMLIESAERDGCDCVATGHYGKVCRLSNGRYAVANSITAEKDQTYALCRLEQEQLRKIIMPLGGYTKEHVRKIASEAGIPVAKKKESMEVCFIPDNDHSGFICRYRNFVPAEGDFVDMQGRVLGRHKGIIRYTVGQRRGLELAMGKRVFVKEIRPDRNQVVIGENSDLFTDVVKAENPVFMGVEPFRGEREFTAKIRYSHKGEKCRISMENDGTITCRFDSPVRAAAKGQALVFYEDEYIAGSGIIF